MPATGGLAELTAAKNRKLEEQRVRRLSTLVQIRVILRAILMFSQPVFAR